MKRFEDFLLKNPLKKAMISKMFFEEVERSSNKDTSESARLITASMLATSKLIDLRLKAYHNWLHQNEKST